MLRKGIHHLQLLLLLCLLVVGVFTIPQHTAYAAPDTAVRVVSVEYYEEQIIVLNNGNTKIYFATETEASKNNWEVIASDTGLFTMIDISWLSSTVENILVIKGQENPLQSRVIISERPLKLEISINYANIDSLDKDDTIAPLVNIMTSVGNGQDPIDLDDLEWRKGTVGQWTSTRSLTVGLLEKYLVKGAYLYFRIRAVDDHVDITDSLSTAVDLNDDRIDGIQGGIRYRYLIEPLTFGTKYPDGTKGRRFSNEIKVKVVKKSTAMVYGVDGGKFSVDIKYGKEFRVTTGGITSGWAQVNDRTVKSLPFTTILNSSTYDGTTKLKAFPAIKIEIRDYATTKSASSKISEINLAAQRTLNNNIIEGSVPVNAIELGDDNIYVYYNGNKNMVITIPKATPNLPYEYCVVKNGDTFDVTKVVWSSITKGTDVKLLASKAVEAGTLYVRQKEIKSQLATKNSAAIGYKLASTYVTHFINYPSIPEIADASYTFTKGYSGAITFNAVLNTAGKKAFETEIKNIKLGTKEILFTATTTTSAAGVSTMAITLTKESLATMTNCFYKAISITYKNGTVDKTSVKMTIQSPTTSGVLTITNAKGTNTGTTAFTMVTSKAAANSWAYVVTPAIISGVTTMDKVSTITPATSTTFTTTTVDNVTVAANQYLTIFEVDATGYIVKYKSILITADYIK